MFCMTGHTVGERGSNVAKVHHFAHSSPAEIHAMSRATNKKEWTLSRVVCSTHEFEICVHPKHAK